jgi:hypothetical protein
MKIKRLGLWLCMAAVLLSASACTQPEEPVEIITPEPTPFPETYQIYLPPYLPDMLAEMALSIPGLVESESSESAHLRLDIGGEGAEFDWVYALAAPFSYIGTGVRIENLQRFWVGEVVNDFPADSILVDESTASVFEIVWGIPDNDRVQIINGADLLEKAWELENVFAILPFEHLEPSWQVLEVDGLSPIRKDFDRERYALVVPFALVGSPADLMGMNYRMAQAQIITEHLTNRQADKLTTVITTGVTALVRATAFIMEASGMTYPAINIGDILREADILHINNEVPFAENCPRPFANPYNDANMIFCSKPEYIQLLEAIGTDVVELAGDHFWDWGEQAMLTTIDLYDQRGWQYYGGGRNYTDGVAPALFEHNGNKIAFLGCNAKPPGYATATETYPGAVQCDLDLMADQIASMEEQGYLPIFTFQHTEYYSYQIVESLQKDFERVADAGAVIVQGSQAHQPHGIGIYKDAFLHYGLGNLFFDQYFESAAQREAFIDRHVIYNGKHISTELIAIQFIDNARPRLMTEDERESLLIKVFAASGW